MERILPEMEAFKVTIQNVVIIRAIWCMIQIYKCWHTKYALMKEKHYKAIREEELDEYEHGEGDEGGESFKKDKMNMNGMRVRMSIDYYTNTTEIVRVCQTMN